MVLRTRTSCSFKWRACMELRCDWRSTNISETSRFGYSISYILRLVAIPSTENAECGVLPSLGSSDLSTGLNHVALPPKHHAYSSIFRIFFGDLLCLVSLCGGSDRRLEGGGRRRQHPGCRMQWRHVGRGVVGEGAGRPRHKQSGCLKTKQADAGNADPDRHEEEAWRRSMGRPSL